MGQERKKKKIGKFKHHLRHRNYHRRLHRHHRLQDILVVVLIFGLIGYYTMRTMLVLIHHLDTVLVI